MSPTADVPWSLSIRQVAVLEFDAGFGKITRIRQVHDTVAVRQAGFAG